MEAAPDEARKWPMIPIISVLVAMLAVVGGGVVASQRGGSSNTASEVITRPANELAQGAQLLLPNLEDARVVVPDRPHDPGLARDPNRHELLSRTRSFLVSTNSRGFRGPEVATPKARFRIVCLGDSVTFGWGVPVEQSYPHLLAERLGVEVVNTGVPAMKPDSIAAFAERELAGLEPDLVLFARRPNHMHPNPLGEFAGALNKVKRAAGKAPVAVVLPPVSTFDAMGSQIYRQEAQQVRQAIGQTSLIDLTEAFRAALPLPGVLMEVDGQVQRVTRFPGGKVLLEAQAPEVGLAPEVVALFEEDHRVSEPLFFDGGHPDKAGFEVFVEALATWLQEQGLVPTS